MGRHTYTRRVANDAVYLSALRPEVKRQVWIGMNRLDPERAAMLSALQHSAPVQQLRTLFGADWFLTSADFRRYMAAANNQTRR